MVSTRLPYGAAPRQFGDLRVPEGNAKHPVAIVLHGGFWRNKYDLTLMSPLCETLRTAGVASWNLEYRSIGDEGGGWPGTCQDVASGASYLRLIAEAHHLDLSRALTLGHSAGGHLALWLASKQRLTAAVGLGAVADLQRALDLKLSNSVVAEFLHGGAIRDADPKQLLPLHTRIRLFHGKQDDIVPIDIAERFTSAAKAAGDDAQLFPLEGGHFEPIDPKTSQWALVQAEISRIVKSTSWSAV